MAETWVLNSTITLPSSTFSGTFTSNGTSFTRIEQSYGHNISDPLLVYSASSGMSSISTTVYRMGSWVNEAYRTLVFDTAPSGALLTWLQANGVKQSDPEPENPTNACMIDGTVYSIKIGQTLVGGTAQTIYNGRTLVSGTGYDIVLSSSGFAVTIKVNGGSSTAGYAEVIINGTEYVEAASVQIESGTAITLRTSASSRNYRAYTKITIDGVTVAQGTTTAAASYTYTPTGNITVTLDVKGSTYVYGVITITTS